MGSASEPVSRRIEIEEGIEGDRAPHNDYYFDIIGKPIPIISSGSSPLFDLECPPSRPLAVSERHGLIFLAIPAGFCVARTKDVMDGANVIKEKGSGPSVQELSVVDVPIGKVRLLELSADSSTLAVCVAGCVHFFGIDSLVNKEVKPSFSCSLSDSETVKDMRWRKGSGTSYLVLSNRGKLYHGSFGSGPFKHVMDNVDAVDWSVKGKFIAVVKGNVLSILSSKFTERLSISLPFKPWIDDSDDNYFVKADCIRWVRLDSIILGCFQQTADGKEESYLVQVIRSKDGKSVNASSELVLLSFYDLFADPVDDIVPYGSGPYLFSSYLEQCGLAITACMKNKEQHIVLLGWSVDDESDTAILDIERDTWVPRIELQGNGDDNFIMGLCVDKVSLYGKANVEVGVEEEKELSPYCVLMCVTIEGKLVMFYVASATGITVVSEIDSEDNEGEETSMEGPAGFNQSGSGGQRLEQEDLHLQLPGISRKDPNIGEYEVIPLRENEGEETSVEGPAGFNQSGSGGQRLEQEILHQQLPDVSRKDPNIVEYERIPLRENVKPSEKNESTTSILFTKQMPHKDATIKNQEDDSLVSSKPLITLVQQKMPVANIFHNIDDKERQHSVPQGTQVFQSPPTSSIHDWPPYFVRDSSKMETQNLSVRDSSKMETQNVSVYIRGPGFSGEAVNNVVSQAKHEFSPKSVQSAKELQGKVCSSDLPPVQSESSAGGHNVLGKPSVKPFEWQGTGQHIPVQMGMQRFSVMGGSKIDSLPSLRNLSSQDSSLSGYSNHTKAPQSDFKPNLSRQFGNIKEIVVELDTLLQRIQEEGGFRDDCTVSLRSSVEALEEGMGTISGKCRMWKSVMDERLGDIQHLLDKTVQVLARKIHMEGIAKQASDSQYWELWNRQKLSSELELKRQHIVHLNQDLTNRLIELERHFNAVELQRFGANDGVHAGRKAFQSRYAPSRHIQAMHGLHNTLNSQLAAAEQLSESLSKQMAVLSIESPVKQRSIRKELFETIGIPFDTSFSSPDAPKVCNASSSKKLTLLSGSAATTDLSRRRQSSAMKSLDSETARRRRDSLDLSWASFVPTKTTVKRMLLRESGKENVNKFKPCLPKESAVTNSEDQTSPSILYHLGSKAGIQDTLSRHAIDKMSTPSKWTNDSPSVLPQTTGSRLPMLRSNDVSLSSVTPTMRQSSADVTADKSSSRLFAIEKSDSLLVNEMKSRAQTQVLLGKSGEMSNSNTEGSFLSKVTTETMKHGPASIKSSFSECPFSSLATSVAPTSPRKFPPINVVTSKSHADHKVSFSAGLSAATSVSSSPTVNSSWNTPTSLSPPNSTSSTFSAASSLGLSLTISKTTVDASQAGFSTSLPFAQPPALASSGPLSLEAPKTELPLYASPSVSESQKTEFQHPASKVPLFVNQTPSPSISESLKTDVQPPANSSASSLNSASSAASGSLKAGLQLPTVKTPPTSGSVKTEIQQPTGKATPFNPTPQASLPSEREFPPPGEKPSLKSDTNAFPKAQLLRPETPAFSLKVEPVVSAVPRTEILADLVSGSQPILNNTVSPPSSISINTQPQQPSAAHVPSGAPHAPSNSVTSGKNESLDISVREEDDMEEEASDTIPMNELSLGSLGGFGMGSSPGPSPAVPRANPFGDPFGTTGPSQASTSFMMTVPSGELFRPASFNFQSPQTSQPPPSSNLGGFSGSFGTGVVAQPATPSGFGQPAQIGLGQQALGSVLGSFGQSRQIGVGLPGSGFGSPSGFGGGFAGASSTGGFSSAATGGGFAGAASVGGGFAALGSGGKGFATVASGGGIAGAAPSSGGFAAVASVGSGFAGGGGGFGTFSNQQGFGGFSSFGSSQQGSGGFSAFGHNTGGPGKPPELFTQMRK